VLPPEPNLEGRVHRATHIHIHTSIHVGMGSPAGHTRTHEQTPHPEKTASSAIVKGGGGRHPTCQHRRALCSYWRSSPQLLRIALHHTVSNSLHHRRCIGQRGTGRQWPWWTLRGTCT
jgi:hypothetical protein